MISFKQFHLWNEAINRTNMSSAIENLLNILWLVTNLFDVCCIKKAQLQIAITV